MLLEKSKQKNSFVWLLNKVQTEKKSIETIQSRLNSLYVRLFSVTVPSLCNSEQYLIGNSAHTSTETDAFKYQLHTCNRCAYVLMSAHVDVCVKYRLPSKIDVYNYLGCFVLFSTWKFILNISTHSWQNSFFLVEHHIGWFAIVLLCSIFHLNAKICWSEAHSVLLNVSSSYYFYLSFHFFSSILSVFCLLVAKCTQQDRYSAE